MAINPAVSKSAYKHPFPDTAWIKLLIPTFHLPLAFCVFPVPAIRAHGALGEQASGTSPARRHLLGCAGDQVFGERLTARLLALLPGVRDLRRALPGAPQH